VKNRHLRKLDSWLLEHRGIFAVIVVMLLLRLPNFFEPYWYGDEGIYLTIGNALRHGERLYSQIIDHKTPLIYYMAMLPSQLLFRVLLAAWMTVTLVLFHSWASTFWKSSKWALAASTLLMVITTLPALEGNIPNGELFVMGFVVAAGWLMSHTQWWADLLGSQDYSDHTFKFSKSQQLLLMTLAGGSLSLAALTKVPAVFDAAALGSVLWFGWLQKQTAPRARFNLLSLFRHIFMPALALSIGFVVPVLLSVIYFAARGSLSEYIQFGWLYNFHYAGNWSLTVNPAWMAWLFTLPGKLAVSAALFAALSLFSRRLEGKLQFILWWLVLTLVSSTLSNRPYPHYFLQLVPPACLLVFYWIERLFELKKPTLQFFKKNTLGLSLTALVSLISLFILTTINIYGYPTLAYYTRFAKLITGQISREEYRQQFDYLMNDNYHAAQIIKTAGVEEIFIWGTNPTLYALSGTEPTGRFTVSFHIHDLKAYEETLRDLKAANPTFIVVMKDETGTFPGFFEYLHEGYIPNQNFDRFKLWKKQSKV
jgi:hypothetical protein